MLLVLLKSVKKWVFSIFLDNKIADNDIDLLSVSLKEDIDDEGL